MKMTDYLKKLKVALRLARRGLLVRELRDRRLQRGRVRLVESWSVYQAGGRPFEHSLKGNIRILLYPDDKLSEAVYKGDFELDEQFFLYRYLRAGDVFVDVGANIGLYTLVAARLVGKSGRVYAFEPTCLTYERLTRNVELNRFRNVECAQLALSDKAECLTLTTAADGFGAWSSLAHPTAGSTFSQEEVRCTTWDNFAADHDLIGKVTSVKIDVEGWELRVINGGGEVFARPDAPDLLVEFTEVNAQAASTSCAELYHCLQQFGYSMYSINAKAKALIPEPLRDTYPYLNLLATKRLDFVRRRTLL
jgi:FkbM family methyltransferase